MAAYNAQRGRKSNAPRMCWVRSLAFGFLTVAFLASFTATSMAQLPEDGSTVQGTNTVLRLLVGVPLVTAMAYYGGSETPRWTRNYYLFLGSFILLKFPMLDSRDPDFRAKMPGYGYMLLLSLPAFALAGLNHYYLTHPEYTKHQRGQANAVGIWAMVLTTTLIGRAIPSLGSGETEVSPFIRAGTIGLGLSIRF